MILSEGATVEDVCKQIHRTLAKKFKYARLWGPSAKFPGQMVRKIHKEIQEGDVIEIHAA